jgi:hypothetical protein
MRITDSPGGGTVYCNNSTNSRAWTELTCEYTPLADETVYFNLFSDSNPDYSARFDEVKIRRVSLGGAEFAGTLLNTTGSAINNATIEIWLTDTLITSTNTDSFGQYIVNGLLEGQQYDVRAYQFYNITPITGQCYADDVEYRGYIPKTQTATFPNSGVNFVLGRLPIKGLDYFTSSTLWTTFWSQNSSENGYLLRRGDIITSKDPDGILNGMTINCWPDGRGWYNLKSWGDDSDTPGIDEGAENGDQISFFINNNSATVISGIDIWDMLSHNTDLSA